LNLSDVASALFEQVPNVENEQQVEKLRSVLLLACHDVSADINDIRAEKVIAEWLSESLSLYTPSNSWASIYYLYGYLKGFRHKTMLDSELDPETDLWLRTWVDDHFEVTDDPPVS